MSIFVNIRYDHEGEVQVRTSEGAFVYHRDENFMALELTMPYPGAYVSGRSDGSKSVNPLLQLRMQDGLPGRAKEGPTVIEFVGCKEFSFFNVEIVNNRVLVGLIKYKRG